MKLQKFSVFGGFAKSPINVKTCFPSQFSHEDADLLLLQSDAVTVLNFEMHLVLNKQTSEGRSDNEAP